MWSHRACLVGAAAVAALAAAPAHAVAQLPTTTRASLSSTGAAANADSFDGTVSANGRYVVFNSFAGNLVSADTNGADIFLRDRQTGVTTRLNVGPGGVQANAEALFPEMSADARLVLFYSQATNLVPGVTTSAPRIYLADTTTGAVRVAATVPATHVLVGSTDSTVLSRDGSRVVFAAARISGGIVDVFAADTATGAVRRVSETAMGTGANFTSFDLAVSGNGRFVAFTTDATNLATPDINGWRDIVVADLQTGAFERASVPSGPPTAAANLHSSQPSLSFDGCQVAFRSDSNNLVAPSPPIASGYIYLRNRCSAETEVVSLNNSGTGGLGYEPSISQDGCLVGYRSTNVSPAPSSGYAAVLRDRCTGLTTRLDLSTAGEPASLDAQGLRLSGGTGRYVAFWTSSANLVAGDAGNIDVFVRDRALNAKPVAELALSQDGALVTADAGGSSDPDGPTISGRIAWGDGSPDATGVQAQHRYARGGSYAVTVTITDGDGATSTRTVAVTIPDAPPVGGGPPATQPRAALVLDRVSLSRRSFAVVPRGRRTGGRRGSTLALRLTEAATVRLAFARARAGRRSGVRCVIGGRRGTPCTRYTSLGTMTRSLPAGTSRIALSGRVGRRTLTPGRHRLSLSARTADGRTANRTVMLTIIRLR